MLISLWLQTLALWPCLEVPIRHLRLSRLCGERRGWVFFPMLLPYGCSSQFQLFCPARNYRIWRSRIPHCFHEAHLYLQIFIQTHVGTWRKLCFRISPFWFYSNECTRSICGLFMFFFLNIKLVDSQKTNSTNIR